MTQNIQGEDRRWWLKDTGKWYGAALTFVAVLALTIIFWGGQWLTPAAREEPHPTQPQRQLQVWAVVGSGADAAERLPQLLSSQNMPVDILVPAWYSLNADGSLVGQADHQLLAAAQAEDMSLQPLVRLLDTPEDVPFYRSMAGRRTASQTLTQLVQDPAISGLHLEIRQISDQTDGTTRGLLPFLRRLAKDLKRQGGKQLIVHVDPNHRGTNLLHLTQPADAIHLTAFRTYTTDDEPGPPQPLAWLRTAVDRALAEVQNSQQLILGVAAFGYDWPTGEQEQTGPLPVPLSRVNSLIGHGDSGELQRMETQTARLLEPGGLRQREIWFEDGPALRPKLQYAREARLAGIMVWNLEFTDGSYWQAVEQERHAQLP